MKLSRRSAILSGVLAVFCPWRLAREPFSPEQLASPFFQTLLRLDPFKPFTGDRLMVEGKWVNQFTVPDWYQGGRGVVAWEIQGQPKLIHSSYDPKDPNGVRDAIQTIRRFWYPRMIARNKR